jgi:SulP family sulfate permease
LVVALIMVAFAPYARLIPRAALAGILIVSAWKMIDWRGLSYHLRVTRFDSAIVWVTAISAVAISIEFCVLIGVVMSSLLTVRRAGRMLLTEFTITPDGMIRERFPDDARCNRLLIYGLEGELFFGSSAALERHFERIEQRIDGRTRAVILRLKRARNADAAGMIQLRDFVERVRARDVDVILCGVRADLAQRLETTRLSERTGATIFREERVPLTSTILAIRHAYQLIGDPCASCPRRDPGDSNPSLRYVI